MSGVSTALTAVKDRYYGALATASVSYFALTTWAFAQGADPKAPLDFQKQAQSAASSSRLNPDDAKEGLNNLGSTFLYGGSALSIMFALYSPNGTYDNVFLANYCYININDQMTRIPGIASVTIFGAGKYAMRLWVKPDRLARLNITIPSLRARGCCGSLNSCCPVSGLVMD